MELYITQNQDSFNNSIMFEPSLFDSKRHSTLIEEPKKEFKQLQSTLISGKRKFNSYKKNKQIIKLKDLNKTRFRFGFGFGSEFNIQILNSTDVYKSNLVTNLIKFKPNESRMNSSTSIHSSLSNSSLLEHTTPSKRQNEKLAITKQQETKTRTKKSFKLLNARNIIKFFTSSYSKSKQETTNSNSSQSSAELKLLALSKSKYKKLQIRLKSIDSLTYGFTVFGYCPCQIGKIEKNSVAEQYGLQRGDLIIKINGKNVSRATCDTVVKMIKNSSQNLELDIMRPFTRTVSVPNRLNNYEKIPEALVASTNVQNSTENDTNEYNHLNAYKKSSKSVYKHKISKNKQTPRARRRVNKRADYSISLNNTMPSPIPHMSPINENKVYKKSSIIDSDYKTQSSSTDNDVATISSSLSNIPCSEPNYEEHLALCEKLLNLEEKFIDLMQKGVQQYSRPLRHCMMINTVQHYTLFQNIEKILAISEYQLNQLINQDDSILLDMFSTIGKLYENKMRMSCEAFDIYLNGIENSFSLLSSLENALNSNFSKFLYESQQDIEMDLRTFLLLPIYYVAEIQQCLKQIKEKTSAKNSDYLFLNSLVNNLEFYVQKSNSIVPGLSRLESRNPLSDVDSKDMQIEESQNKQDYLKLVYSSSIQYRQSCHKWKRVKLLFFEDRVILLSYNSNIDKFLSILKSNSTGSVLDSLNQFTFKSILFSDVLNVNFNLESKQKQFEFVLNYSRTKNTDKFHTIKLKCSNLEDKLKWNKLFANYLN